jgi:hypothetical protein
MLQQPHSYYYCLDCNWTSICCNRLGTSSDKPNPSALFVRDRIATAVPPMRRRRTQYCAARAGETTSKKTPWWNPERGQRKTPNKNHRENAMGAGYLNRWIAWNRNQVLLIESGRATCFSDTRDQGHQGCQSGSTEQHPATAGARGGGKGRGSMARYLGGREAGAGSPLHGSPAARSRTGRREGQRGGGRRRVKSNYQLPRAIMESGAGCTERAGRKERE